MFKVGDVIDCVITEIDKEKRRVAISHRLTKENPYETLEKKYPVGSDIEGKISSINEYAIYLNIETFDIDVFLHSNDLSYTGNPEEELKKYKKGETLKVQVLEIKKDEQKVRVGLKQTTTDPLNYFNNKKVNDVVTVKVISSDNKGLIVKPENSDLNLLASIFSDGVNTSRILFQISSSEAKGRTENLLGLFSSFFSICPIKNS